MGQDPVKVDPKHYKLESENAETAPHPLYEANVDRAAIVRDRLARTIYFQGGLRLFS
jgi:hypothetical protein